MKGAVLTESTCYFFNFYQTLSAPAISTDASQIGVALFPSFENISYHFTFPSFPFILISLEMKYKQM
jgi:hypothetical protein